MRVLIFFFLLLAGCKKDSTSSGAKNVEYQFTTTAAQGVVIYANEAQQQMGTSAVSGWKYSFSTEKKPFTTYLQGVAMGPGTPSMSVKILVGGQVMASQSGTGGVQVQYVIQ
jgi:nickel-dependent lactate racemase